MHDLRSLFLLVAFRKILANLPIEGRLQRVLDGGGSAFDEEHVLAVRRGNGHAREGLDELGHVCRVDV
jgi:hypothetical protein